jgi:hypothetical protein
MDVKLKGEALERHSFPKPTASLIHKASAAAWSSIQSLHRSISLAIRVLTVIARSAGDRRRRQLSQRPALLIFAGALHREATIAAAICDQCVRHRGRRLHRVRFGRCAGFPGAPRPTQANPCLPPPHPGKPLPSGPKRHHARLPFGTSLQVVTAHCSSVQGQKVIKKKMELGKFG